MATWVVSVTSSFDGETRVYGSWRTSEPAREFAGKLIDLGLSAQPCDIERPTLKQVETFWGELPIDRGEG